MKLHIRERDFTCHIGSHSFTFHPKQANRPCLALTQARGRYSIYLTWRGGRLSWPRWPVKYWDGLPAHRRSPIQPVSARPGVEFAICWSQVWRCNHYITKPP